MKKGATTPPCFVPEASTRVHAISSALFCTYTAGSAGLTQLIPDWAHEGGREALLGRLRDPEARARIRQEVLAFGREWDRIYVTTVQSDANRRLEGKTLAEAWKEAGHEQRRHDGSANE